MTDRKEQKTVLIQRPQKIGPWAKNAGLPDKNGTVWISMRPRRILDQFSKGVGDIAAVDLPEKFRFLAPKVLSEHIIHHWEAYESVASRIAQKARSAVKLGAEGAALVRTATSIDSTEIQKLFRSKSADTGVSVENYVKYAYGKVATSRIPKIKIDTPLYYTNSERRQIIFDFQLFHENLNEQKPEEVLIKPIQKLMKYSSPNLHSGGLSIDFPYMWEVVVEPYEFIRYTTCALIGVQPTWNSPYIRGVPSSVNLQLTFLDMSPLYKDTIESGSVIRVISQQEAASRNSTGLKPVIASTSKSIRNVIRAGTDRAGITKREVDKVLPVPGNN